MQEEYFPESLTLKKLERKVNKKLKKYDIEPHNTLLAVSTCADELERRVENQFSKHWHMGFILSGLSGFPFTGPTGIKAARHHVTDGGNLFIIYCPHIGISKDGVLGVVERRGMDEVSTCCGANIHAYNHSEHSPGDYQENYIIDKVNKYRNNFTDDEQKNMVILVNIIRREIRRDMRELIKGLDVPVVLLGGININTKKKDYFQVYDFSLYKNGEYINLLQ